jgi:multiple sugar transport system substrate-binding protein
MRVPISRPIVAAVIAMAVVMLSSCGQNGGNDVDSTIRFWHFWSEPGQRAVLERLIARFEDSLGVTVELTELSWNDGKAKLQAAFNSGTPPDVVELGSDWVAQFSSAGVLLELPVTEPYVGRFVPYAIAPAMWNGKLYALPWTIDTRVLFVNRDILKKAGWKGALDTWDQVYEASESVAAIGGYGYGANGADAHRLYKKILPMYWTYEAENAQREGRPFNDMVDKDGHVTFANASWKQAFEQYAKLARTGFIETQRQLDAAFVQGKVAFWNSGSWLLKRIRETKDLHVDALPMPSAGKLQGISFAGGEYLAVASKTRNSQRSRDLVEYLTSALTALEMCKGVPEAGFPADRTTYQDASLLSDGMKSVFAGQLEHARMTPVHPRWLDIESILEDALIKVLLGEAEVDSALKEAQDEVDLLTRRPS